MSSTIKLPKPYKIDKNIALKFKEYVLIYNLYFL